jgi:Tol biopolymer transport system component
MDELDLFRDFRRGADAPSADAQRRASDRLESVLAQAPGRAQAGRRFRRRRWPHIVVLAAASLVLVVGTASAFGTVRDLFLGDRVNSKIAFMSIRNERVNVYVMNANGSGQRRLLRNAGGVAWSPDGRKIAFTRQTWANQNRQTLPDEHLYVMNADGSGLLRLTSDQASDAFPVWSPDGRKIAFQRRTGILAESDVYVIDVDGSGERNLTGDGTSSPPVWSPDGRKIAFGSWRDGGWGAIYLMNADGSGQRRLAGGFPVAWSPNGRRILFVRVGGVGRGGPAAAYVYVMNADGSGQRRLTRTAQGSPSWSPDGRKIVFVSVRDGNFEVYVMNPDGSGQRNLTRHPGFDNAPAWSPDGRKIAFTTKRDGNFEVYVMNADGGGQQNLTRNPAIDRYPVWSPGRPRS